jgi:hypothetical protein
MWQAPPSLPHGIGLHPPLQYVPAPHATLQAPQLNGSLERLTHLPLQQARPKPHDASHPAPLPLLPPVLAPLLLPVLAPLLLPVLAPLLLPLLFPVLAPLPFPVLAPLRLPLPPPVLAPLPLPVPLLLPVLAPLLLPVLAPLLPPPPVPVLPLPLWLPLALPPPPVPLLPPEPPLPLDVDASVESPTSELNTAPPQSGMAATNAVNPNDHPRNPASERIADLPTRPRHKMSDVRPSVDTAQRGRARHRSVRPAHTRASCAGRGRVRKPLRVRALEDASET